MSPCNLDKIIQIKETLCKWNWFTYQNLTLIGLIECLETENEQRPDLLVPWYGM
jgi:hypothetical protein